MQRRAQTLAIVALCALPFFLAGACASNASAPETGVGAAAGHSSTATNGGGGTGGSGGVGGTDVPDAGYTSLLGVWQVTGDDDRGPYQGQLELRDSDGGQAAVYRVVHYTGGVTVEDGRELWTAWTGTATVSGLTAQVSVSLRRADFVLSRDGVTRTAADLTPLAVTGSVTADVSGVSAHWSADGVSLDDTLTDLAPNGAEPIFATDRTSVPANDPPSADTLATLNALYASFQALPAVQPYANDPAFQAGVYYLDVDQTDYAFYQVHPNALRVVDKIVDAPSLGETLARANAYRQTLLGKAAFFDAETPQTFLEPATGQLVDSVVGGVQQASGDGALWTATYIASQAYRYFVTQDPDVLTHIATSAAGIQVLIEIVPDQTTFARTARAATGAPPSGWHTGTGPYSAYEWLEGGNNDMYKGLFYGTLMAYAALCDPQVAGQEALCDRMRTNAQHMVDDLAVVQGSTNGNHLLAAWLAYYLTSDLGDMADAMSDWATQATIIENAGFQTKELCTADWSGTHLTFVEMIGMSMLDARKPLPTINASTSIRKGIEKMQSDFTTFRMGLWSVLFASKVTVPAQVDIDSARWRLREIPAPRMQLDIDHRVGPGFVMAPFPSLPWKNDWTTTDRTDSLHGFPLFEQPLDVYAWRSGPFDYWGNREGSLSPSVDYLHAYWLGRYLGLFDASE